MHAYLDPDLIIFALTLGVVLTRTVPRMRQSGRVMPRTQNYQEVPSEALTDAQKNLFAPYDAKLEKLSYRPALTYRVANVGSGHNLQRYYVNPLDTAYCVVMIVELTVKTSRGPSFGHSESVRFRTNFTDGKNLTTRNNRLKSVMDDPPYRIVQSCPRLNDLAELKRRHDKRAAVMGCPVTPAATADAVFKEAQRDHERFLDYQIQTGIYEPTQDGRIYRLASKAHWRAVWHHYNLFTHHFSAVRLVTAIFFGTALPAFMWLQWAPAIRMAAERAGAPALLIVEAAAYASYAAAGTIVGWMLDRSSFLWSFVLTYAAAHVAVGWTIPPHAFSTVAAVFAYRVSQAKKRSQLVMIPAPSRSRS